MENIEKKKEEIVLKKHNKYRLLVHRNFIMRRQNVSKVVVKWGSISGNNII